MALMMAVLLTSGWCCDPCKSDFRGPAVTWRSKSDLDCKLDANTWGGYAWGLLFDAAVNSLTFLYETGTECILHCMTSLIRVLISLGSPRECHNHPCDLNKWLDFGIWMDRLADVSVNMKSFSGRSKHLTGSTWKQFWRPALINRPPCIHTARTCINISVGKIF